MPWPAGLLAVAGLLAILFAFKAAHELSRLWVGAWLIAGGVALVGNRLLLRAVLVRGDAAHSLVRRLAVAGAGDQLAELLRRLRATAAGFKVAAVLDLDGTLAGRWPEGALPLSGFADLTERAYRGEVDDIVLALPARPDFGLEDALLAPTSITVRGATSSLSGQCSTVAATPCRRPRRHKGRRARTAALRSFTTCVPKPSAQSPQLSVASF